jgi:signal peptidase II
MSTDAPTSRWRIELLVLGLVAVVWLVADQVTKALVAANIQVGGQSQVLGDLVIIWHVRNSGSAFSMFQFQGSLILFYVVHVLAIGMVAYFHRTFHDRSLWLQVILGMLLGGSIGNLADRIRHGYVTDFISVGFGDTRFPTWNIADSGITVGIILLVAYLVLFEPRRAASPS